ncbi:RNA-binding protein 38-like isoform X2 [Antedon mediterranea]|uniref:RNA-binding protein 38-like isoform X2 n=1 Tax=Antedon mediterranea TaxID=105859 RepID=UPI003AF83A94
MLPGQKDTTFTKIFVGGLPFNTSDDTLKDFFKPFGEIEEAVVITDRATGKSKGYGFVTMSTKESAAAACKDPNPIIDGRKANVNLAFLGAKPRNNPTTANVYPRSFQSPVLVQSPYGALQSPSSQYIYYHPALISQSGLQYQQPASPTATQPFVEYPGAYSTSQHYNTAAAYEQYAYATQGFVTPGYGYTTVPQQQVSSMPAYQATQQVQPERIP